MTFPPLPGRRLRHALACAVLALAACGGGTSQYETFVPGRLLVFGDETSALTTAGLKYSINAIGTSTDGSGNTVEALDCNAQPNWVQSLAGYYGFVFAECNPGNVAVPQARMLALPGTKVDDLKVQIDSQLAAGGFRDRDLVTVLLGANDIVSVYQDFPGRSEADLLEDLRNRGRRLAAQVNRLVELGAKVIIVTVPDMGLSPYARKQKAEFPGTDRAALLSRLTAAFNEQLGVNVLLDGRFVGLVQGDLRIQAMARVPQAFGLVNVDTGVCTEASPPPLCTTNTLIENGTATGYLWSDDLNLAYPAHTQLASLAIDRARLNPF